MPPTTTFIIQKPHKNSWLRCPCRLRRNRAVCGHGAFAQGEETDPDRLEFHVAERTRELARANAELLAEVRERRLVEQALRDSEARYRVVVEQAREVICTTDTQGNWTFLNPAWTQITGFDVEESLGQSFLRYVYEEDRAHHIASFQPMVTGEQDYFCQEVRYLTRDGGICWIESRCQKTTDAEGNLVGFSGTLNDISERKQAEEQLQHQALHDTLTGLPNRLLFQDRLRRALARAQRSHCGLAVLFVDLDNFKVVNDSMGHEAGDALLMTIAARLQSSGREEDTIARLGGDEFTLLLENLTDAQDAIDVAERIVTQLQYPIPLDDREVFASASIGIVYSDAIAAQPDALLRDADTAMYHAKAQGKSGYVLFDPSMNKGAMERMEIETGLRLAIERDELRVHYQPLVDLQTGRLCGMEALTRWEHPTRGLMPPGTFIPIAEETGLIVPIGYWVLEEACRQTREWKALCPDAQGLIVNVNLSGRQLQRPDAVQRVREALTRSGLPATDLKLEITESVMMTDVDATLVKLRELKAMGVRLAMDDFGTGYSSMASMSRFPLDTVKIDRAFISLLDDAEEARAIVAAIVMLSRAMRLDVTAEGIETRQQWRQVQRLGCNVGQGYYFAPALPLEALRDYAAAEHGFVNACPPLPLAA